MNIHLKSEVETTEEIVNTEIVLLPSNMTDEGANQELIFLQTDSNQPIMLTNQNLEELGIIIDSPDQIWGTPINLKQSYFELVSCKGIYSIEIIAEIQLSSC